MIHWLQPKRIHVRKMPLTDAEMLVAFRVEETHPLWVGVLQLIEDEIRTANEAAQISVGNHGICASEIGGVQHLERLRDRLFETRAQAIQKR